MQKVSPSVLLPPNPACCSGQILVPYAPCQSVSRRRQVKAQREGTVLEGWGEGARQAGVMFGRLLHQFESP